jgi:hypothetical protein
MGVNKFNLQLYAKTFQFLHNSRHLDSCGKFIKILSVLIIATIFHIMSVPNYKANPSFAVYQVVQVIKIDSFRSLK